MYLLVLDLGLYLTFLLLDSLLKLVEIEHFYLLYKIFAVIIINNDEYYYSLKISMEARREKCPTQRENIGDGVDKSV